MQIEPAMREIFIERGERGREKGGREEERRRERGRERDGVIKTVINFCLKKKNETKL